MRRKESVIFANMCMICDDKGNVVVQDRVGEMWSGAAFPGGHVEEGESFTDAVIREVFEETGLTVSELQMCGIKNWFEDDGTRYVVHLYKTDKFEGELKSSDEGEVFWTPLSELLNLKLCVGMKEMFRVYCDSTVTEEIVYSENGEWKYVFK